MMLIDILCVLRLYLLALAVRQTDLSAVRKGQPLTLELVVFPVQPLHICEGILLHRNFASFYMWFWAKIKPCRQYRAYTVSKSYSRKKYKYSTNKGLVQPLKKGYTNTAVRSFPLCRWSSHLRRCKRIAVLLHCRFLFSDRIIAYIAHLFNGYFPQI